MRASFGSVVAIVVLSACDGGGSGPGSTAADGGPGAPVLVAPPASVAEAGSARPSKCSQEPAATDAYVGKAFDSAFEAPFTCSQPLVWKAFITTLKEELGVDYAEYRQGESYVEGFAGSVCSGASDAPACQTAYEGVLARAETCWGRYVVWTRGNDAGRIVDIASLVAFAGAIDKPAKAWLASHYEGFGPRCQLTEDEDGKWWRAVPGGMEIWADVKLDCSTGKRRRIVVKVTPDGTFTPQAAVDEPYTGFCD